MVVSAHTTPAVPAVVGGRVSESSAARPGMTAPPASSVLTRPSPATASVVTSSRSWARRCARKTTRRCRWAGAAALPSHMRVTCTCRYTANSSSSPWSVPTFRLVCTFRIKAGSSVATSLNRHARRCRCRWRTWSCSSATGRTSPADWPHSIARASSVSIGDTTPLPGVGPPPMPRGRRHGAEHSGEGCERQVTCFTLPGCPLGTRTLWTHEPGRRRRAARRDPDRHPVPAPVARTGPRARAGDHDVGQGKDVR